MPRMRMKYITELPGKPKKKKDDILKGLLQAIAETTIGFRILIPIMLGLTLGIACDKVFGVQPTGTVVFLFVGTLAGFYNIYRLVQEHNATHQHKG